MSVLWAMWRGKKPPSDPAPPTLGALSLNTAAIATGSVEDTLVGTILGLTGGSTVTLQDDAGDRFKIVGNQVFAGSVATDYDIDTSHDITIRETLTGATNTPRDTVISITVLDNAGAIAIALTSGITDNKPDFDLNWLDSNPQVGWTLRYYQRATDEVSYTLWHSRVLTADDITGPVSAAGAAALDDGTYIMYAVLYNGSIELGPSNEVAVTIDVASDVTAPTITALSPEDAEPQALIAANSVMTFSENVEYGANMSIRLTRTGVGLVEELTEADIGTKLTIAGNQLTINWSADMLNSTAYDIQWDAGLVEDAAGNQLAASSGATDWNFTTIASSDCDATFIGSVDSTADATVYTFNGTSVGSAFAGRRLVVALEARGVGMNATVPISGVTCNGDAMSPVVQAAGTGSPGTAAALFEIVEPDGTTADFVVTFAQSGQTHCAMDVYSIAGSGGAATDTAQSTAVPPSDTITVPTNGCVIGVVGFGASGSSGSVAWTNLSEDSDRVPESGSNSSAAHSNSAGGGDLTITATLSGTTVSRRQMVAAAWSP
jgi:hypothetical protein